MAMTEDELVVESAEALGVEEELNDSMDSAASESSARSLLGSDEVGG